MTRRGSHHGAGSFLPNQTPDRFKQATYFTNILLAKIGLTIDFYFRMVTKIFMTLLRVRDNL